MPDMCLGTSPVQLSMIDWEGLSDTGRKRVYVNNCVWAWYCDKKQFSEAECDG